MKQSLILTSFFVLGALSLPVHAQADVRWELQSEENQLTLSGNCDTDIHIELYESENFELDPLYTAVAPCTNNTFTHDDNLLKWGMADGQYKLVVESNRHTVRDFSIKEPPVTTEEAVAREAREKGLPSEVGMSANQIFENAQASFGSKLYSLETDLITMQQSLKDTTYPDFIKLGLGAALGIVESTTKKLAGAFFIVEQRDFTDTSASVESPETVPEPTSPESITEVLPEESANTEVTNDTTVVTEDRVEDENLNAE